MITQNTKVNANLISNTDNNLSSNNENAQCVVTTAANGSVASIETYI